MRKTETKALWMVVPLLAVLLCIAGCGQRNPSAEDWFPFVKGRTWRACGGVQANNRKQMGRSYNSLVNTHRMIVSVQDAAVDNGTCSAVLRIEGAESLRRSLPPSMVIGATKTRLTTNFLINPEPALVNVPMQLKPSLCILRLPVLDGDSWEWRGKAVAIDEGESVARQRLEIPAKATVTIRRVSAVQKETQSEWAKSGIKQDSLYTDKPRSDLTYQIPEDAVYAAVTMVFTAEGRSHKLHYYYTIAPGVGIVRYVVRTKDRASSIDEFFQTGYDLWLMPAD